MNCTGCNTPLAAHELVEGKCVRCWASAFETLRRAVAQVEVHRSEQRDVEIMALKGEIAELRQAHEVLSVTSKSIIAGLEAEVRDLKLEAKIQDSDKVQP